MKLLDRIALKERGIRYSDSQLWRKVKDKSFPQPIKIGANRIAWVEDEIDSWVAAKIRERDTVTEAA